MGLGMSNQDPLDEAIAYIENQIKAVLGKTLQARSKIIEASKAVLDTLKTLTTNPPFTVSYRLGKVYDPFVRAEFSGQSLADIEKPKMTLQYSGSKMTLTYDDKSIEVPTIPQFLFEPISYLDRMHDLTVETLRGNIMFRFPYETNIEEEADIENMYNKFYFSSYAGTEKAEDTIGDPLTGRIIAGSGMTVQISEFRRKSRTVFTRLLHINGVELAFSLTVNRGILVGTATYATGTPTADVQLPAMFLAFLTKYEGVVDALFFQYELPKGEFNANVNAYIRYALVVQLGGQLQFVLIE